MTRQLALLLTVVATFAAAPAAEAKKRVRHSHVPACAAWVGALCSERFYNWRPGAVACLAPPKEIREWNLGA
ncbi:MAG: hypothetical protein QOE69_2139 [Thermoleophilaceae bacterium]|jgi:hypothetical protein|nr:hypothetical protein [Thermoleophilaceae bacterium]